MIAVSCCWSTVSHQLPALLDRAHSCSLPWWFHHGQHRASSHAHGPYSQLSVWREVANIAGLGCRGFFAHDRSIDCPLDLGTVIGMKAPSPVLCPGAWPSPRGASCPTCVNSARIIRGGSPAISERRVYRASARLCRQDSQLPGLATILQGPLSPTPYSRLNDSVEGSVMKPDSHFKRLILLAWEGMFTTAEKIM
jgi:hypothetical protein